MGRGEKGGVCGIFSFPLHPPPSAGPMQPGAACWDLAGEGGGEPAAQAGPRQSSEHDFGSSHFMYLLMYLLLGQEMDILGLLFL